MQLDVPGMGSFKSHRFFRVAKTAAILAMAFCKPALAERVPCPDVLQLLNESKTQFSKISNGISEYGGLQSTLELPGAQHCIVVEGIANSSYRCTWKYPYRDELAGAAYKELAQEVAGCFGDKVQMRPDKAVNHPDTYESNLFSISGTEARVTLKDKRELGITFVFFVMEGRVGNR